MNNKAATNTVEDIINNYVSEPDSLISILQDIQSEYHYLPEDALRQVSSSMGLPLIQVYGVGTFFKAFSLKPQGKHLISVCLGTACHVRGATSLQEELERQLKIKSGDTTEDLQFTLKSVNCLGACALGPIMVIDEKYYGQMNAGKVKKILAKYKIKESAKAEDDEKAEVAG